MIKTLKIRLFNLLCIKGCSLYYGLQQAKRFYLSQYARVANSVNMSLRQLCKETSKRPLKVLLYFPQERTTGIAPSRLILGKSFEYKEGSMVTVNWEGKKIQAEIIAMDGKSYNLSF